ncbi:MAG: TolC family protein [Gemmatimonadota bacterium]|nr:TolC family protein [Gemmatimonadota bacterium]
MLGVLALLGTLQGSAARDTILISLDDAAQRAVSVSPLVEAARGEVSRARGLRAESGWPFAGNPTVGYTRTRRRTTGLTTHDYDWTIAQEVEIAGQSFLRRGAASALTRASVARVDDSRRLAALEARSTYVSLSVAEQRSVLADSAAAFAERLAGFARRQFDAGEMNRLELNAATLEGARARSSADRTAAEREAARAELHRVLGIPGDSMIRTVALPSVPDLTWTSDSTLLAVARARRPDLLAALEIYGSARRFATLAGRALVPNLALSLNTGQEAGTDRLFGVGVGVSVPLFYRQQGAKGAATAELATAHAQTVALERRIVAELRTSTAAYTRAHSAERRFAADVLGAAIENVALTEQALREGEVSLTDVILLRRTAIDAQLEYLDVLTTSYFAWFDLAAALGGEPHDLPALLRGMEP